jgi:hypothetical protein
MLGDRVRVKYLVGNKVEEEIIEVKSNGGTAVVLEPMASGGSMVVQERAKSGQVLRSAAFNPLFVIVAIEERRRR